MTVSWLDFRSEPLSNVPEIEEYINIYEWSAKCTDENCNWHARGERSYVEWMDDMHDDIARHKQWHEEGCPE
jgi:hypothetical protein